MAFEYVKEFARRVRFVFSKEFIRSISDIVNGENISTDVMMEAIDNWLEMYGGNAPWLNKNRQSLGLPAIIASEMARCVTLEMEVNVAGSPMADFINEQLKPVLKNIRQNTEYACAGGGIVFKPTLDGDSITTEVVKANSFYPVAYNNNHEITAAYFVYRHWEGKKVYTRLEKHELNGNAYRITNRAFVSTIEEALGKECNLAEVAAWADITPEVNIQDIEAPLFAYFRIPLGNTVDSDSPLGVSVYARAVDNIMEADKQYQRLLWEYEGGELAIDASEDAFKMVNGVPIVPEGKERLFRVNNLDSAVGEGKAMSPWTPSLRDANYITGLNKLLSKIEDQCCLSRGTLSDPNDIAKTATELKILKQRSYATVSDIQESLEDALEGLIYAMYCIATLYGIAPDGKYETSYKWDDSIIVDAEAERERDRQDVRDGFMQKWEYRAKWYGEDEATAKKMVAEMEEPEDDEVFGFDNGKKQKKDKEDE